MRWLVIAVCLGRAATFAGGRGWCLRRTRVAGSRDESVDDSADAARVEEFRARLIAGGLEGVSTSRSAEESAMWARGGGRVERGCVLLGSEEFFFGSSGGRLREAALRRVGLPPDVATSLPEERRKNLLPVVLMLDAGASPSGVLMGRRSGFIMGDFKQLDASQFVVQPLWVGGPSAPPRHDIHLRTVGADDSSKQPTGILAIHPYAKIDDAARLNDDGLCCGGDWALVKDLVKRGRANPYRFRLVAQATTWNPGELDKEIDAGVWTVAQVSTDLLLKDRQPGTKPIWLDIQEHL